MTECSMPIKEPLSVSIELSPLRKGGLVRAKKTIKSCLCTLNLISGNIKIKYKHLNKGEIYTGIRFVIVQILMNPGNDFLFSETLKSLFPVLFPFMSSSYICPLNGNIREPIEDGLRDKAAAKSRVKSYTVAFFYLFFCPILLYFAVLHFA